jgi:hypothetical protein
MSYYIKIEIYCYFNQTFYSTYISWERFFKLGFTLTKQVSNQILYSNSGFKLEKIHGKQKSKNKRKEEKE